MPQNSPNTGTRAIDIERAEKKLRDVLKEECDSPEDAITVALLFIATVFHPSIHEMVHDKFKPHFDAIHANALAVLNTVGHTSDLTVN